MAPTVYRRVAVIGGGPSGLAALHALANEQKFDEITLFERKDQVGGTWVYNAEPEPFLSMTKGPPTRKQPSTIPSFQPPAPEDLTTRTTIYDALDSNVGAQVMAFTHTSFPLVNSAVSVARYGQGNPTRPWRIIADYIETLYAPFTHLISMNTSVENIEKVDNEWMLILRQSGKRFRGQLQDYWYQKRFDAVIVASGHYGVATIPEIPGLDEFDRRYPGRVEHSKSYRHPDAYVDKTTIVVGGNISASDLVVDLHPLVKGPLYVSQRGKNPALDHVWEIPNVQTKPVINSFSIEDNGTLEFSDGSKLNDVEKIVFATGYQLSYPFLKPNPVTKGNRLEGFYQHIWKISDPSLAVVGQVRAALSFRVYEYQAVAVARFLAGRGGKLPSDEEQHEWERKRFDYKGPNADFYAINPDIGEYFTFLRDFAGPPALESNAYRLPKWDDAWLDKGFAVLALKDKLARTLSGRGEEKGIKAKL